MEERIHLVWSVCLLPLKPVFPHARAHAHTLTQIIKNITSYFIVSNISALSLPLQAKNDMSTSVQSSNPVIFWTELGM